MYADLIDNDVLYKYRKIILVNVYVINYIPIFCVLSERGQSKKWNCTEENNAFCQILTNG